MDVVQRKLGWLRQPLDQRDFKYQVPRPLLSVSLPLTVDLRPKCPPILDQGELGSCTANALASAFRFNMRKQGVREFAPSRLFIYFNEREMEGSIPHDAGAYLRDGAKCVNKLGICAEDRPDAAQNWPYNIQSFRDRPRKECYTHALNHQALYYASVGQSLTELKSVLAEEQPIVFGFSVYDSFYDIGGDGVCKMPAHSEKLQGGHAVLLVGYSDEGFAGCPPRHFIVKNSWGSRWGAEGYFYMPYEYVTSPELASDFWLIKNVEPGDGQC